MISETIYQRMATQLQEAFADLESHLDDPDNSRLSAQGMLELTRDRLASLTAALFAPGMPPIQRLERPAAPAPLESTDAWGRPRCQQMVAYVDHPSSTQCALTEDHNGECDTLPEIPDEQPATDPGGFGNDALAEISGSPAPGSNVAGWTDTRHDDGRWLTGSGACPRGCSHVLMAHRTDVGCVSCDCEHGIPGRGAELIDRAKSHVLPADLIDGYGQG